MTIQAAAVLLNKVLQVGASPEGMEKQPKLKSKFNPEARESEYAQAPNSANRELQKADIWQPSGRIVCDAVLGALVFDAHKF